MSNNKTIFHIDADSFFASAEVSLRPELKNKDIAISYGKSNSIVTALSYSTKVKGAKVPMKFYEVKKICPNIINLQPNYFLYEEISKKIYKFLCKKFFNKVEIGSIDEWYVDATNFLKNYLEPKQLAKNIQKEIELKFNLSVSIGISYNRFLAKMATDINKPKGITLIKKSDIEKMLWPMGIEKYIGIGSKLINKLKNININTIGDLANVNKNNVKFKKIFKNQLDIYIDNANGIGDDQIITNTMTESIGAQHTFEVGLTNDINIIYNVLKNLCLRIANELKLKNQNTNQIRVMIKNKEKKIITSSIKFFIPTNQEDIIYENSLKVLNKIWFEDEIIVIGVTSCTLMSIYDNSNISLFEENKKENKVLKIINDVNAKIKTNNLKFMSDIKKGNAND